MNNIVKYSYDISIILFDKFLNPLSYTLTENSALSEKDFREGGQGIALLLENGYYQE